MATAYAIAPEPPSATETTDYRRVRFTADEFLDMEALGAFENRND